MVVNTEPLPLFHWILYPVIAGPVLAGAVNVNATEVAFLDDNTGTDGWGGALPAISRVWTETGPYPTKLIAETVNKYWLPGIKPV